ncbi:MAG: hypothetical protein ABEI07_02360, partial [Candidatus Nanohaloarchaea archaeon]
EEGIEEEALSEEAGEGEGEEEKSEGEEEDRDVRELFFQDIDSVPLVGEIKKIQYTVILPETGEESTRRVLDVVYQDGNELLIQIPADAVEAEDLPDYEPDYDFFNVNGREVEGTVEHDGALVTGAGDFSGGIQKAVEEAGTVDMEELGFLDRETMEGFPEQIGDFELVFLAVDRDSPLIVSGKESPGYELTYYSQEEDLNVMLTEYSLDIQEGDLGGEAHELDGREVRKGRTGFGEEYLAAVEDGEVVGAASVDEADTELLEMFLEERLSEV